MDQFDRLNFREWSGLEHEISVTFQLFPEQPVFLDREFVLRGQRQDQMIRIEEPSCHAVDVLPILTISHSSPKRKLSPEPALSMFETIVSNMIISTPPWLESSTRAGRSNYSTPLTVI
jgi:hypothetical protein